MLERLPENARVAVIRLRSLGDCVLTTPALSVLKQARPDLEIAVAVESRFAAVFEGNPAVSRILEPAIGSIFRFRPALCLNLHGGTRSMWMTALSGAGFRSGFAHHNGSWIYNHPIPRAQEILGVNRTVHTAEHLASAMFHLGVPQMAIPRAALFAESIPISRPYTIIHPVAATPTKTWSADGFRRVAEHLQRDHGLEAIFIAGPGENLDAFRDFRTVSNAPLRQTKSLLKDASFFVGNDSGPAHMAAAFGVPAVVLFGPSDEIVWAPWKTPNEILADKTGIYRIKVDAVIEAIDRLKVRA